MLTVHDVVRPSLDCLTQDLPLEDPTAFWKLFDLLTRESLALPIAVDGPRFSGICADGTPWQFCVSLGAAVMGDLRYLTEIGEPGAPTSVRVHLARRRLDEAMGLLRLPPQTAETVDALFGLLPQAGDRLNALRSGIWVGVGVCAGKLAIRLYANNEWDDELSRWQRLTDALRRLRAYGFGRLLRDNIADITRSFSPVGLAGSLGSKTILKLYLRPRSIPWDACARLTRRSDFCLPAALLGDLEDALKLPLANAPGRLLVLSIGGSVDGEEPDLKLDLNGQYLFDAAHPPEKVVETLTASWRIDPAPYKEMLAILRRTAPPGLAPVHDFIGVGGGARGLRLNVYLRPPVRADLSDEPALARRPLVAADALVSVEEYQASRKDVAVITINNVREERGAVERNRMRKLERDVLNAAMRSEVRAIYSESYAAQYPFLYTIPWLRKHQLNAKNLATILDELNDPLPRWLDLACGQAWHFSVFPGRARMFGLDISEAQLARARMSVPCAAFVCGDVMGANFPTASFDLVTNFWAGYCYLRSRVRIAKLWRSAVDWIAPGGALYIEVLLGQNVEGFNRSPFSERTGFAVSPRSEDYSEWQHEDIGGRHVMTSPPLEEFLNVLSPHFRAVDARHDDAFMVHLIATGRR